MRGVIPSKSKKCDNFALDVSIQNLKRGSCRTQMLQADCIDDLGPRSLGLSYPQIEQVPTINNLLPTPSRKKLIPSPQKQFKSL